MIKLNQANFNNNSFNKNTRLGLTQQIKNNPSVGKKTKSQIFNLRTIFTVNAVDKVAARAAQ